MAPRQRWADRDIKPKAAGAVLITLCLSCCRGDKGNKGCLQMTTQHGASKEKVRHFFLMETAESRQVGVKSPNRCAVDEVCCGGASWRHIHFDTVY